MDITNPVDLEWNNITGVPTVWPGTLPWGSLTGIPTVWAGTLPWASITDIPAFGLGSNVAYPSDKIPIDEIQSGTWPGPADSANTVAWSDISGIPSVWAGTIPFSQVTDVPAYALLTGAVFDGPITVVASSTHGVAINGSSGVDGANLDLIGNGTVTPSKTIRAQAGLLEVVNDSYSAVILSITDSGDVTITGSITAENLSGTNTGDQNLSTLLSTLDEVASSVSVGADDTYPIGANFGSGLYYVGGGSDTTVNMLVLVMGGGLATGNVDLTAGAQLTMGNVLYANGSAKGPFNIYRLGG